MTVNTRIEKFDQYVAVQNVECHFDERTGIMKIYFDDTVDIADLPTDAEFMELFAHRRKGQPITGLALFPKSVTVGNG